MQPSDIQIAEIDDLNDRETPLVAVLTDDTLDRLGDLSDIGRKRVVISVVAAWIAGEMQGDDESAGMLLESVYSDMQINLARYCEFYRQSAPGHQS